MFRYDLRAIKRINRAKGGSFFKRENMEYLDSKISKTVYNGNGGVYIVTSERNGPRKSRRWTVRQFHPATGRIATAGVYAAHLDSAQAHRSARAFAHGGLV